MGKHSGRDSIFGTVIAVVGYTEDDSLANYFDGDELNLDKLTKDGIYTLAMTDEQRELVKKQ